MLRQAEPRFNSFVTAFKERSTSDQPARTIQARSNTTNVCRGEPGRDHQALRAAHVGRAELQAGQTHPWEEEQLCVADPILATLSD